MQQLDNISKHIGGVMGSMRKIWEKPKEPEGPIYFANAGLSEAVTTPIPTKPVTKLDKAKVLLREALTELNSKLQMLDSEQTELERKLANVKGEIEALTKQRNGINSTIDIIP